jgi:hypothetical protein
MVKQGKMLERRTLDDGEPHFGIGMWSYVSSHVVGIRICEPRHSPRTQVSVALKNSQARSCYAVY